jgi:GNAT superfamily N-acetyltransferase
MTLIRKGVIEDLPQVLELIKGLAEYENALEQVTNNVEAMIKDGFSNNPLYGLLVADKAGNLVGYSIYYYRYSTWKGKRLFLEDIYVTESERDTGIGKELFNNTMEIGKKSKCTGMMWQVLDWNKPAIDFYSRYDASFDDEWVNCHLDF